MRIKRGEQLKWEETPTRNAERKRKVRLKEV